MNRISRNTTAALAGLALTGSLAFSAVPAFADDSTATVVADVVLTPAPVVDSQLSAAAQTEKAAQDPAATLAEIKAKSAAAIARRQTDIAARQAKLSAQTTDCGYNAARGAEMTTTATALTALGTSIGAATDAAAARTSYKTIAPDYRVYLVVLPKVGKALRCDHQLTRIAELGTAAAKVQAAIDAAKAQGANTTLAQTQKDYAVGLVSGVQPRSAIDSCMGLVPDRGDRGVQASNASALGACDGALDANQKTLKAAAEKLHEAWQSLRGAKAEDRAADKAKREAEKAQRQADKQARKAQREAEKAQREAEKAQREAEKAARRGGVVVVAKA